MREFIPVFCQDSGEARCAWDYNFCICFLLAEDYGFCFVGEGDDVFFVYAMVVGVALECFYSYQEDVAAYIKLSIFGRAEVEFFDGFDFFVGEVDGVGFAAHDFKAFLQGLEVCMQFFLTGCRHDFF